MFARLLSISPKLEDKGIDIRKGRGFLIGSQDLSQ